MAQTLVASTSSVATDGKWAQALLISARADYFVNRCLACDEEKVQRTRASQVISRSTRLPARSFSHGMQVHRRWRAFAGLLLAADEAPDPDQGHACYCSAPNVLAPNSNWVMNKPPT